MNTKCNKKKFTKLEAMMYIAQAEMQNKKRKGKSKRRECRYYYCKECNAYHMTSKFNTLKGEVSNGTNSKKNRE